MKIRCTFTVDDRGESVDIDVNNISPAQIDRVIQILQGLKATLWPEEEPHDVP